MDGWEQAEKRVKQASDGELQTIWSALGLERWGNGDMSSYDNVTMDDWAELVQSEIHNRH